jgi:hypothetical protein
MDNYAIVRTIIILIFSAQILSFLLFPSRRNEIILASMSILFVLFTTEVYLSIFYPQKTDHDVMFEFDRTLGWRFIPNKTGSIVYRGEAHHYIKINPSGFRDDPIPKNNDDVRKILVVGDSFVSNISVKHDDVFTEVMQKQMDNTSVINFGVNGYGQVQEYLLLEKFLDIVKPDFVIQLVYIRNDFLDNTSGDRRYPCPSAEWNEKNSIIKLLPPKTVKYKSTKTKFQKAILHKFHLYFLIDHRLTVLRNKFSFLKTREYQPSIWTPPELYLCCKDKSAEVDRLFKIMEQLLQKTALLLNKNDIPFLFVLAPSFLQVDDKLWTNTLGKFVEDLEQYNQSLPNQRLVKFAKSNRMPMLDLLPILRSETKMGKILYHPNEQHWNKYGNRVVASTLLKCLASL